MKVKQILHTLTLLVLFSGFMSVASAQDSEEELPKRSKTTRVDATDPKFDELPSPNINTGVNKKFRPKDWLEIETSLRVKKIKPKPKDGYIDSLKIKWYIVVKGQDRKAYLIEKVVEHVNIPTDETVVASVYLSPNTLKRITGKDSAGKNDLEAVGGEVILGTELVGYFNHGGKKAGWWRKKLESVERTGKFPLLNKDETPFKILWHDRYAEIAKKRR